jgi:uncharacterized protein YkwD
MLIALVQIIKSMTIRTKLAITFTMMWVTSVAVFLFVSFSNHPDGLYSSSQNTILVLSVCVGVISFLAFVFCLNKSLKSNTIKEKYHRENSKGARISNKYILAFIWLIIGLFGGFYGSNYYYRVVEVDPAYISTSSSTDMIRLINKDRIAVGLQPLTENKLLDQSARNKACDMRDKNYFEHVSPDGKEPWVFMDAVGYKYTTAGENIAVAYNSTKKLALGYMKSESHRDNILNPEYTEVGVGECGMYSVEHFGSRK